MNRRRFVLAPAFAALAQAVKRPSVSGVYPHLAMFNGGNECGTGGVVPWAGKLWVVTYSPHAPGGSDDKLYEIDEQLNQTIRPESIGGTPANRMIHRESKQLFLGPYVIDAQGGVRVIPYSQMFGRPTGNAAHLTDPWNKIYYASMEEGFYEVDVKTLAVRQLYEDANAALARQAAKDISGPLLPGYHGKGFYSGQGRVVYSNNGEVGGGLLPPDTPSGCLAEWDGQKWKVIRRNQFTDVTGPGGIEGSTDSRKDPVWAIGWDHRSLILMVLDSGTWHSYRLPKASHAYDGAHGWNTEWPRIREIGETDLLMTMHGMFWRFPRTFRRGSSAGIAPRSTYVRVIGDFARWRDRVVFGCDDAAKSEFLNTRRAKGKIAGPGLSQSNLWFVEPAQLDRFGPPVGRGAVWIREDVRAAVPSEPFLFAGFARRMAHFTHESEAEVTFRLEVDAAGDGLWSMLREVKVGPRGSGFVVFAPEEQGAWVRVTASRDCRGVTVFFQFSAADARALAPVRRGAGAAGGWVWANEKKGLYLAEGNALFELDEGLALRPVHDMKARAWMDENLRPPQGVLEEDAASVIYRDEQGRRWRLPKSAAVAEGVRVSREVSTERDLFHAHGTFYELPANNAGGFAVVRPITTHNLPVRDYCSWRGLIVISGLGGMRLPAGETVRSRDGRVSLWLGAADDLWKFGKPCGEGGPWRNTAARAGEASDPYLMTGYDQKHLRLEHGLPIPLAIRVEVDITGTGLWVPYETFTVAAGRPLEHRFPAGFQAYWVRMVALAEARVTAILTYR